jgi:hypothetical protein
MSEESQAFARNPYRFMEQNIVVTPDNPPQQAYVGQGNDRCVWISVDRFEGTVMAKGEEKGKVCAMTFGDDKPDAIKVYWCVYKSESNGTATMLGNTSLYMFTVTMNACSLGIGTQKDGFVRVAHANWGSKAKGDDLQQMMENQGKAQEQGLQEVGTSQRILHPLDYMVNGQGVFDVKVKSTTFGMHLWGKDWAFFTLRYKILSGGAPPRYEHLGITHAMGGWGS